MVLGTHGRRGVDRLLMGSDAEQVARIAPVPVMLVRQPQSAAVTSQPGGWALRVTAVQPKHFVQRLGAAAVLLLSLSIASENAFAQEQSCPRDNPLRLTGTLNLRIDNDMFGGVGQDRGTPMGFSSVGSLQT